jgi:5-methylcytosine-specific restriction endonuclease McrA
MIRIPKPSEELINEYKNKVIPKIKKKIEMEKIDGEYESIIIEIEKNLDNLISLKLDNVLKIYCDIQNKFPQYLKKFNETITKEQKLFNNFIKRIFDYESIISKNTEFSYKISRNIGVDVCPYCNRIYTTTYDGKNGKIRPEFDHFYAKSLYPILSLSIYNLIPSCSQCNSIKRDKEFSIENNLYPYEEGIESIKYFSYILDENNKAVITTIKGNKKMDNNSEKLEIENIYKVAHSNVVDDLIKKVNIYNEMYIDELNKYGIKITKDEIRYFLGYSDIENIKNTSLGKLKNDILDELL